MRTTESKRKTLFITGAAGYVGAMLVDQFSGRDDVGTIIALDKEACPDFLKDRAGVIWIQWNLADEGWEALVSPYRPNIVIHCAWEIRELYGRRALQWRWNVGGSERVFRFAFSQSGVETLIHFSSAAVYGASPAQRPEYRFRESDPLREEEYSYGKEKKHTEELLHSLRQSHGRVSRPCVYVVRPAAITGPRGRFMRVRFGLQSALSGDLTEDFLYRIVSLMVSFVPATPWWVRQFVHEDDVCDIISLLAFRGCPPAARAGASRAGGGPYEVFNLAPPGEPVRARHMARAVGKKVLPVAPWMVRVVYFIFWHLTRGKIPTGRGVWRFYSYPVLIDGGKISRECHYTYRYDSLTAFQTTPGRYEQYVPPEKRT
jgi:nucleoside-diphosphate-sugar epimerase